MDQNVQGTYGFLVNFFVPLSLVFRTPTKDVKYSWFFFFLMFYVFFFYFMCFLFVFCHKFLVLNVNLGKHLYI